MAGTYVLRLTANDSALSANDDVTITVNPGSGGSPPDFTIIALPDTQFYSRDLSPIFSAPDTMDRQQQGSDEHRLRGASG